MALHDVSKSGMSRLNPTPNTIDAQAQRMAHGTTGFTLKLEGSNNVAKLVIKDGKLQIYRTDGTLMVQGGVRESDADAAFQVAKPGQELT